MSYFSIKLHFHEIIVLLELKYYQTVTPYKHEYPEYLWYKILSNPVEKKSTL